MSTDAVLEVTKQVGLPITLLAIGAAVLLVAGRRLLAALLETQRERIAALTAERDHFRDRSEHHDDAMNTLCRELIDACRARAQGRGHDRADSSD